jgi:predicted restriction endonuclease
MDRIRKYINDNIDSKSMEMIYYELTSQYSNNDVNFIMSMEYDYNPKEEREIRYYQQKLKKEALKKFNSKCVISGIDRLLCLEAAHIKPVFVASDYEKADINNILLLWVDIHRYFDTYQISINPETMCVETNVEWLQEYRGKRLDLPLESIKYLEWHYYKYVNDS